MDGVRSLNVTAVARSSFLLNVNHSLPSYSDPPGDIDGT